MHKANTNIVFFVFIILFISFLQSCKQDNTLKPVEIFCDAEQIAEGGKYLISSDTNYLILGGYAQSGEQAHSGRFSIKLSGPDSYGMMLNLKNVQPDDYYQVSVWRKSESNNGILVVSDSTNNKIYLAQRKPVKKDKNGWELLKIDVFVPPNFNEDLKIYIWNKDSATVYFDDLKIVQLPEKIYPIFNQEALWIYIDTLDFKKLYAKRLKAFQDGILESSDDDWVNVIIFHEKKIMNAKIRLKGDWLNHLTGKKWSFRIKFRKNFSWKGMREFSVLNPHLRGFQKEWQAYKLLEKEDVLTTRYGFIPVMLNGKSLGIYAYEEHFVKQLVESQNRREGPILKFTEKEFWLNQKTGIATGTEYEVPFYDASVIVPFKRNRVISSPDLYKQFLIGQNLMFAYKNKLKNSSEIFNIDQLAKYFALVDILKYYHGIIWHNQRFYYNPVLCKLEPIAFDGYIGKGVFDFIKHPIYGNSNFFSTLPSVTLNFNLFGDTAFLYRYIYYLEKYSDENFIRSFQNELISEIQSNEAQLIKEFGTYEFDTLFLENNARAIRDSIKAFKQRVNKDPEYVLKYKKFWSKYSPSDTVLLESFPQAFVKAFLEEKDDRHSTIKIFNYYALDIKILGTGKNNEIINHYLSKQPTLVSYNMSPDSFLIINSTKDAKFVFFSIDKFSEPFAIPVHPWKSPGIITPQQELMVNNKFPVSNIYEVLKDKIVLFKKGNYYVREFIIIPDGYNVKFEAGTTLDFQNNAGFISYSPVEISGSINEPVTITSSDGTAMGFTVLQANKKSIVNYTVFNNLNTLDYNGWTLTGAVNFYESDVDILNTDFDNNLCEDALNIIRSDFNLRNCLFENIFADAFDSDFSDGNVIKTVFQNIGNDAIDFSGSEIYIDSCKIINARDKGISGGEASDIIVRNTIVKGSNIAFASKDNSVVEIYDSQAIDCNYGIVIFKKKPEFGPAVVKAKNFKFENVNTLYLVEKESKLYYNRKIIHGYKKNIAALFYDNY